MTYQDLPGMTSCQEAIGICLAQQKCKQHYIFSEGRWVRAKQRMSY